MVTITEEAFTSGKVGLSTTEAYLHSESITHRGTSSKVYTDYVAQEG